MPSLFLFFKTYRTVNNRAIKYTENKVVKILGLVNCTVDFLSQPKVINGCSDLFVEFFGKEKGMHARSAMGVYVLPNNIPVEIEAIIELKNSI